MRLAVRFAMQPFANRSRALAMSTRPVSTGTPTASIDSTSDFDERQHDVEVVNHQVEDDVDVEAALGKRAEAMDLDEPRIGQQRARGGDRRIEALGVADGEHARRASAAAAIISSASSSDRAIGFSTSDRHAGRQERQRDVAMQLGRHGDRHGVDLPEQLARSRRAARVRFAAAISSARAAIGVDDGDELDARQRRQNPRVMAAEVSDADDGDRSDMSERHQPRRHEDTKTHEESSTRRSS